MLLYRTVHNYALRTLTHTMREGWIYVPVTNWRHVFSIAASLSRYVLAADPFPITLRINNVYSIYSIFIYDVLSPTPPRMSSSFCIILQYICCINSEHALCSTSMLVFHLCILWIHHLHEYIFFTVYIYEGRSQYTHDVTRLSTDGCSMAHGDFSECRCMLLL